MRVDDKNLNVKCIVKNSVGSGSATAKIEVITDLVVSGVEVWVNNTKMTNNLVDLGDDRQEELTLRCVATPSTATIKWFKNIDGVDSELDGKTDKDMVLQVTHVNNMDRYRCKASLTGRPDGASDLQPLFLAYPIQAEFKQEDIADGEKRVTVTANGNPDYTGK